MTTYHIHFFVRTPSGQRVATGVADAEYVNVNEFPTFEEAKETAQITIDDVNGNAGRDHEDGSVLCYQIIGEEEETTKHTPGPWRDTGEYDKANGYYDTTIESDDGEFIAIVRSGNGREQVEANAALISAAPDMLAALRETLESALMLRKQTKAGTDFSDVLDSIIESSQAAIAKVKGRKQ